MNGQLTDSTVFSANGEVASCALGDGAALLDLRTGTYYSMNPVAAHIWDLIQQPAAVRDIVSSVESAFDVAKDACEADVRALLGELSTLDLINIVDGEAH